MHATQHDFGARPRARDNGRDLRGPNRSLCGAQFHSRYASGAVDAEIVDYVVHFVWPRSQVTTYLRTARRYRQNLTKTPLVTVGLAPALFSRLERSQDLDAATSHQIP